MIGFDRGIADDGGLDPEEVLKLFLILAAVMDRAGSLVSVTGAERDTKDRADATDGIGAKTGADFCLCVKDILIIFCIDIFNIVIITMFSHKRLV